jgi:hypothetical protein
VMGYGLDGRGSVPDRGKKFLFSKASRLDLRPTQPTVQENSAKPVVRTRYLSNTSLESVTATTASSVQPFLRMFITGF